MNAYAYLAIHDTACLAAFSFLVYHGHWGWALVPALFCACATVRTTRPTSGTATDGK